MNASTFMDKQIMDLSRSKGDQNTNTTANSGNNNHNHNDFIDLMNPQSEEESDGGSLPSLKRNDEILASYDFQPISRSNFGVQSSDAPAANATSPSAASRAWNSLDSKSSSTPLRSYSSVDPVEPDKVVPEKGQKVNDSAILSEIDRTLKKYTDSLLHAIDSLSARLSQLESRTRNLEYSVDDLKVSVGNNLGSVDGKIRQMENILLEVQTGVQDIKDKQDVMEGHMQLVKLQFSKVEKSSEAPNAVHVEPVQQPQASAPSQPSNLQQSPVAVPQPLPSLSPVVPPPSQQSIHPPPPVATQFPPSQIPAGPQRDAYFVPPGHNQEAPIQPYQIPPPALHPPTPAPASASQPQQYPPAPTPPYPQPPQPQQQPQPQQHPSVAVVNTPSQFQHSPLGQHPEESPYMPAATYPPNPHQPTSQPSSVPPLSHQYYGSPSTMFEPPLSGRSNLGFPAYGPTSGPGEPFPYGGAPSQYGTGSSIKQQPHSPSGGGASSKYPQLPTARILPQAIPTAAAVSGGSSGGGSGNRVPIDDVIDKVTNMGFPREHVRATVRKLTENGQSVDLNVVLDKLMNDGDVQPQRGWFGR